MKCFNKKNRFKKKIIVVLIIAIIFILVNLYIIIVNPIFNSTLEYKSIQLASHSMNLAIRTLVQSNLIYNDFVTIKYNNDGNISFIQANSTKINKISEELAIQTEENIKNYGQSGVGIPLGNFMGISLLSGIGPELKFKIKPIGSVFCKFTSNFETAGINQTIHKIYLTIRSEIGVVIPFYQKTFLAEQQVLAMENIIVGQVPEVYLYSDNLDTLLNFVPY